MEGPGFLRVEEIWFSIRCPWKKNDGKGFEMLLEDLI